MNLTNLLIAVLMGSSVSVWSRLLRRVRHGQSILKMNDEPRATFRSLRELIAVYVTLLWTLIPLTASFLPRSEPSETVISMQSLAILAAMNIALAAALPFVLVSATRPPSSFGLSTLKIADQIKIGILGFLAALIPTAISMAATIQIRPVEHQHALLKLLDHSNDSLTISLIALTAVISAPLLEEMLFRVILQGWLTTFLPPRSSIWIVAIAFCLVHGWRNGLALLPLALILGYVFHRRQSYLAVVMIHLLFNATMLTLQLMNQPIQ